MSNLDFSAFTASLKASKVSETITISRREYDTMQERLAVLQETANRCAKMDLEIINACTSLQQAQKLTAVYNSAWFRDAPYSDDKLREIAEALLEACSTFLPDNQVWFRATQGVYPQADLFAESPYPIKVPKIPLSSKLSGKVPPPENKESQDDEKQADKPKDSQVRVPQVAQS